MCFVYRHSELSVSICRKRQRQTDVRTEQKGSRKDSPFNGFPCLPPNHSNSLRLNTSREHVLFFSTEGTEGTGIRQKKNSKPMNHRVQPTRRSENTLYTQRKSHTKIHTFVFAPELGFLSTLSLIYFYSILV